MGKTFTNEKLNKRAKKFKKNIIRTAKRELLVWRDSSNKKIKEKKQDISILESYYRATGKNQNKAKILAKLAAKNERAWSATFISHCVREAGVREEDGFNFSTRHLTYITHAIVNRENVDTARPFWFYGFDEHEPDIGDFVCLNRKYTRKKKQDDGNIIRKKIYTNWSYKILMRKYIKEKNGVYSAPDEIKHVSHTDIIVDKFEDEDGVFWIRTIGGNVGHTVDIKEFRLTDSGQVDRIRKSNGIESSKHHVFGYIHIVGSLI